MCIEFTGKKYRKYLPAPSHYFLGASKRIVCEGLKTLIHLIHSDFAFVAQDTGDNYLCARPTLNIIRARL